MNTEHADVFERLLMAIGGVATEVEQYYPGLVRRNFGARLFGMAVLSLILVPALTVVAFDSALPAAVVISGTVIVTGFGAYCEMYRTLREINDGLARVEDGQYDIAYAVDRPDEVGEIYDRLEQTAGSLGETITEAEQARKEAEQAREDAENARREAEAEQNELTALTGHLELKAEQYREALAAAADGDLTARVDTDSMNDAMTDVGEQINATLADLERAVAESQQVAGTIAADSDRVATQGDTVADQTETATESVREIAAETDTQQERLGAAAEEMADLSATVEEMAASVAEIAEKSDEAAATGREASDASTEAQQSLTEIRDQTDDAVAAVESLADIVEEVEAVVGVIDDIAEQTNTLALNASIEAARAGEAGEGFAVVADEVKGLAEQTREATADVEGLIDAIDDQVAASRAEITAMRTRVDEGSDTIGGAIDAMDDVVEATVSVNQSIQEVDRAADQQADSAQTVVSIIDDVTDIADRTATRTDEVADTADRQRSAVTEMTDGVRSFALAAEDLQSDLQQFTTGRDHASTDTTAGSVATTD